ncbi:MAG: pilus assembly protein [Gammaproteobacteria bacterium]
MKPKVTRSLRLAAAAALVALAVPAHADDSEIFSGAGNVVSSQRPNILFIMDTSGSMNTDVVTQVPYDPNTTYAGSCSSSRVYFQQGSNSSNPPSCTNANSFPLVAFKCNSAAQQMAIGGYSVVDRGAQWRGSPLRWRGINGNTGNSVWVECRGDAGVHGNGVDPLRLWASDGLTGPWTLLPAQQITWSANGAGSSYVFYSANYINWLRNASTITQTRLEIVQQVATDTINQLVSSNNVNVGLMQFSNNSNNGCSDTGTSEGGMVLREMGAVSTHGPLMVGDIAALNADGCTPLSEAMYEAYLYLSGGRVDYGINSRKDPSATGAFPSISSSRQPAPSDGIYDSPFTVSCQRNFIVLLTDGLPTADNSANPEIQALIGRSCAGTGDGNCLEEIAQYMYENDLRPSLTGLQNVTTYTIGFGDAVAGSTQLRNTAAGAGGVFYEASDTASLSTVLTNIVRTILAFNTSFTAPAVSVNAFNRTQNLNDLYVTVFRPSEVYNWLGNIKKYELDPDGTIKDANDSPAVELSTGFFRSTAQSFWSTVVDGDDVRLGGVAGLLPNAAQRRVYSNISTNPLLSAAANEVATTTAAITAATLGLGAAEAPGRDALINWLRGTDIADENGDGATTDSRQRMGDPMHGRPATVIYGGTVANPDPTDGVLFAVTNEGYLHAVDAVDGNELWAFMPSQLLGRARDMYVNDAVSQRTYGLDGNIRVLRHEVNANGVLEPSLGERVYLFFGMRMGGHEYFGLNVTDRDNPVLMWRIGPNELAPKRLPSAGQSWSTPTVARVNIAGATYATGNTQQYVLVFGGGYDTVQENGPYAVDSSGNQLFLVDALSGNLLWYAGPSSDTGAALRHASMTHSIPGDVRVFDLSGDGFADRMYAADMGGRVWRFDIHNGQDRANLVTGGVFASLGNAHLSTHPNATTRRFYSAPDLSILSQGGRTWINVALGSGYRGHPLNLDTQDRFYSLRDHRPFARLTQAQYDAATVITEADVNLIDVTTDIAPTIPPGAAGWRLDLRRPGGLWTGEKSLSESRTIQSMIQFSTYEPNSASTVVSTSCAPGVGVNRLYTVSAYTGAPVYDRENPADPPDSADDRDSDLSQGGIAPEVVWLFPSPDDPVNCVGPECRPPPQCLVGLENCGTGVNLDPVRTFWRQTGVN